MNAPVVHSHMMPHDAQLGCEVGPACLGEAVMCSDGVLCWHQRRSVGLGQWPQHNSLAGMGCLVCASAHDGQALLRVLGSFCSSSIQLRALTLSSGSLYPDGICTFRNIITHSHTKQHSIVSARSIRALLSAPDPDCMCTLNNYCNTLGNTHNSSTCTTLERCCCEHHTCSIRAASKHC